MATDRNRKRLENIEMALTPGELLACCIEERSKFASRLEYAAWLAEDLNRWPISRIRRRIANASSNGSPVSSRRLRELMFLLNLFPMLDEHMRHVLALDESSLDIITFCVAAAHQSVLFSLKMCELSESLPVATRAPDDDLADAVAFAAETREEFCRHGSTFGGPEIGTSMKFIRAKLCPLLIKVRATIAAIESLNARYFPGLKIMFKSDADALDTLARRAAGLVRDYHNDHGPSRANPLSPGSTRRHRQDRRRSASSRRSRKKLQIWPTSWSPSPTRTPYLRATERKRWTWYDRCSRPRSRRVRETGNVT